MLDRRRILKSMAALAAVPLVGRSPDATAATHAGANTGANAPVDALGLVPAELRGPLEDLRRQYGDWKVDAASLPKLRTFRWGGHEAASPAWEKRAVPGPRGAPDVDVYIVNAGAPGDARPAILHMHGGGYIMGDAASQVPTLQATAAELGCTIVTVEYRLSPEARFPAALEDNYAALRWLHGAAASLGIDPGRIALMGESAGGGHAAQLAIAARDRGEFHPCMQVLVYPMLDDRTGSTRAVPAHIGSYAWSRDSNRYGWSAYLGMPAGSASAPAGAVPARVADLARLPPAWIGVGSIDLFVQEDVDYARRLVEAGVQVELQVVPGGFHGFDSIAPQASVSKAFRASWQAALRRAWA